LLTVQSQAASAVVRFFFAEACRQVKHLGFDERQRLHYLCAEAELAQKRCTPSCEELEMRCRSLSKSYVAVAAQQEVKQTQGHQSIWSDQRGEPQLQNRLQDSDKVAPHAVVHSHFNDAYQVFCNMEQRAAPAADQNGITKGKTQVQQPEAFSQPMRRAASKQLAPPLDFVPQYISLDNLQCYRKEYQRFRIGDAIGAKGELLSWVTRGTDPEGSKVIKRLPPPLDFIPSDISREKLEAYRMEYQEFREGGSTGAKGEVEKLVEKDEPHFISLDNLLSVGHEYNVAQAPLHHVRGRVAANSGSASSASSPLHQAIDTSPEHPTHTEGTCRDRAASPTTGSEDEDALPDRQPPSWDSTRDILSDISHLPGPVKNTLLHLPEDDEHDPDEEENKVKLLPPLDFLPNTVSADKLKACWLDYENFRSGTSNGAKGEISKTLQQ